ncbi:hypothetical protein ACFQ9X_37240 [Catenulispora yoronensis]
MTAIGMNNGFPVGPSARRLTAQNATWLSPSGSLVPRECAGTMRIPS